MLLSRDATQKKLEDPPRSFFGILRPPIFHPKKIEGPPISHPPPPPPTSNLNYDWSLIYLRRIPFDSPQLLDFFGIQLEFNMVVMHAEILTHLKCSAGYCSHAGKRS